MYLIDDTYFQGVLEIPLLDEANSKNLTALTRVIDEKCRYVLRNCLPTDQFNDLDSYIDSNGELDPMAPAKWQNLVNGVLYTNPYGLDSTWRGLIWEEGSAKGSLLAWFCRYHFGEQYGSYLTGVGEARAEAKNANTVHSVASSVKFWNGFVSMYQGNFNPCGCGYLDVYDYLYEYQWWNYNRTVSNYEISLIQFLVENKTDYPDLKPVLYETSNVWGI